jgi:2-hydroxychromene-2-carboxylate isomerase
LSDESWRGVAENHRNELLSSGLWGVPSFRVSGLPAYWGQDRLWCLENDLIRLRT